MTNKTKDPRELWILYNHHGNIDCVMSEEQNLLHNSYQNIAFQIPVIEKQAYDTLLAEAEAMADGLRFVVDGNVCHYHPVTDVCENGEHCEVCHARHALNRWQKFKENK